MRLRTKATLFFGLLLSSIVVVDIFYVQYIVGGTFTSQTMKSFRVITEQTESTFISFVDKMEECALDLASDYPFFDIAQSILQSESGSMSRATSIQEFVTYINNRESPHNGTIMLVDLYDKEGVVVASTILSRIGVNATSTQSGNTDLFSQAIALENGGTVVDTLVFDESISPLPTTRVAVRVPAQKKIDSDKTMADGVLVVYFLNVDKLATLMMGEIDGSSDKRVSSTALLDSYKTSEVYLVNSEYLLGTPTRSIRDVGVRQKVDTLPARACFERGEEINDEYDNYKGERVIGSSMCLRQYGVAMILEIQREEIFATLNTITKWTTAGVMVTFAFGVIIVAIFIRRPIRRIDEIVAAFDRVINGDLSVSVRTGVSDEIGRLSSMFNLMVDSIRRNQKELEEARDDLEEKTVILEKDVVLHEKQEKFLEESKRATLNLLEDSWKAKEALEEEGNKLQTILSSIGDGLILIDNDYKVVLVNTKATEIFAIPKEELFGKDLRNEVKLYRRTKLIPPEHWPIQEVLLTKNAIVTGVEENFSITTRGLELPVPISFSIAPIYGKFSGVVIVFRDVTADRELDEAKSGFISVASHQLRTPLTSIRWYSEMLLSEDAGPLNVSQRDFMQEIHNGAERLYKTVDLLLGISRIESGKMKIDRVKIDIGTFTAGVVKELSSLLTEKNLTLTVSPSDTTPVVVWLDTIVLRQVILNIISNAIRYTNNDGLINVSWMMGSNGEGLIYMVRDNGIGIPEVQKGRIFSKFFRAENARTFVPDGSGLGLALVKELVESWGGKVWFESKENQGTTFFFTIPLSTQVEM